MKSIANKEFSVSDGKTVTVAELLESCLSSPPTGGFDFATMRARLRVSSAMEPYKNVAGVDIQLEDADYATAVEAIKSTRWARYEKYLVEFGELFGL